MRHRHLIDRQSGKSWSSFCDGAIVRVRTGAPGKEKDSEKPQDSADAALAWAEKEEWGRIKKGWVLNQPDAPAGEPGLHSLRTRAYTGAIAIADVEGKLLCNGFDEELQTDRLFLLDENGEQTALPALPGRHLVWKAIYLPTLRRLLLKADHSVLSWTLGDAGYVQLCQPNAHPVSCLDAVGELAVWYAEPDLIVVNLQTGQQLLKLPLPYELHGGHSPQMEAALSPDGKTLAYCARAGEIVLFDMARGAARASLTGEFAMVIGLRYSVDGRYLLAETRYGNSSHLCFDMQTLALRKDWIASTFDGRTSIALSPDGKRIAIANARQMQVYDSATLVCQLRFRIDHVIKRSSIGWVGPYLAVQTDYGCASLYVLE